MDKDGPDLTIVKTQEYSNIITDAETGNKKDLHLTRIEITLSKNAIKCVLTTNIVMFSCMVEQAINGETVNFTEKVANGTETLTRISTDHLTTTQRVETKDKMFVH